jgi:predicted SnoaL-like aldol condensation-catalyzing enzyme
MSTTAIRKPKSATNRAALREAVAALNEGRPEDYLALFDPDARLHGFTAGIEDVEGLVRFHAATIDAYPDATVTLDDTVAERDRVATRYTWRATQAPGWDLVAHGGAIVRFVDGQIVECWNLPTELRAVAA